MLLRSRSKNGSSADRIMHGNELGAIRESRLDLDFRNHLGDAIHHLGAGQHMSAGFHQLGDGASITGAFQNEIADQGDRLRDD